MLMCACGSALVCGLSLIWGRVVAPLDVLTDTRRVVGLVLSLSGEPREKETVDSGCE